MLDETDQPGLGIRLGRLISYFTVQSNVLVAVTSVQLARDPGRDGPTWRVVRLAAVVGITVTGVVHFLLLRPLLDLDGADYVADKLLHLDHREPEGVAGVVVTSVGVAMSILLLFGAARLVDRRASVAP